MGSRTNIKTSPIYREYARKPYLNQDKSYSDMMKIVPEKALFNQRLGVHSELKKPYLPEEYQEMEQNSQPRQINLQHPPIEWPGLWGDGPMPVPPVVPTTTPVRRWPGPGGFEFVPVDPIEVYVPGQPAGEEIVVTAPAIISDIIPERYIIIRFGGTTCIVWDTENNSYASGLTGTQNYDLLPKWLADMEVLSRDTTPSRDYVEYAEASAQVDGSLYISECNYNASNGSATDREPNPIIGEDSVDEYTVSVSYSYPVICNTSPLVELCEISYNITEYTSYPDENYLGALRVRFSGVTTNINAFFRIREELNRSRYVVWNARDNIIYDCFQCPQYHVGDICQIEEEYKTYTYTAILPNGTVLATVSRDFDVLKYYHCSESRRCQDDDITTNTEEVLHNRSVAEAFSSNIGVVIYGYCYTKIYNDGSEQKSCHYAAQMTTGGESLNPLTEPVNSALSSAIANMMSAHPHAGNFSVEIR